MLRSLKDKLPLAALCVWCLLLLAARITYAGHRTFTFLAWNLFLAVVPVVAAAALRALSTRRAALIARGAAFVVWLAFLPNAPYLVTDLIHLRSRPPVPPWYDLAMLATFAATGVLLCYVSVADVEAAVSRHLGRAGGSTVALVSLALCGPGIYLGRFLRWNTWDLVMSPDAIAGQAAAGLLDPLAYQRAWVFSAIYGGSLVLGYLGIRALARTLPARH